MAGFIDIITEKLGIRGQGGGGGDKSQFFLAGGLVLIIIISITIIFSSMTGGGSGPKAPTELKFYDLETKEVVTMDPNKMTPEEMMPMDMDNRIVNPETGKKTLVPMMKCPACEKWFVPEAYLQNSSPMMMPDMKFICTECGTDINQWYRDHRKKRKK